VSQAGTKFDGSAQEPSTSTQQALFRWMYAREIACEWKHHLHQHQASANGTLNEGLGKLDSGALGRRQTSTSLPGSKSAGRLGLTVPAFTFSTHDAVCAWSNRVSRFRCRRDCECERGRSKVRAPTDVSPPNEEVP